MALKASRKWLRLGAGATRNVRLRQLSTPEPAYVFHPNVQTLEADIQALHWTNTVPIDHPPAVIEELRSSLDVTPFQSAIEKCVIVARNYETQEEERVPHEYPISLLQNLLKTVMTFAPDYPQLRDLNVSYEPSVAATWTYLDRRMAVRGRPGTFLTSKRKHPLFYGRDDIANSSQTPLQPMGEMSPFIDLQEYTVKTTNRLGLLKGRAFPYLHTLFLVDHEGTPEIQLLQKAVTYSFGALAAQAVECHGDEVIGSDLPSPEALQCIITNGKRFSFMWYQLNTLDTNRLPGDDRLPGDGVRNLVHIDRPGKLYSKIRAIAGRRRKAVEDLDSDILRTFLSVLLLR